MSGHIENVDLQVPILYLHFRYAKIDPNRSHILLICGEKLDDLVFHVTSTLKVYPNFNAYGLLVRFLELRK